MPRRRRTLSDDDTRLWRKVTEKIDPLKPDRKALAPDPPQPPRPAPKRATPQPPKPIAPFRIGSKAPETLPAPPPVDSAPQHVSPNMDKRNFQRLLRGKIDIDATLDLHGMTAEQARSHLILFLQRAHMRGARLILVITGKGKRTHIDEFNRPVSGVLRSSLPDWLRSGALSGIVLQVTQAHPKHGGKGAFYVYLRRKR